MGVSCFIPLTQEEAAFFVSVFYMKKSKLGEFKGSAQVVRVGLEAITDGSPKPALSSLPACHLRRLRRGPGEKKVLTRQSLTRSRVVNTEASHQG